MLCFWSSLGVSVVRVFWVFDNLVIIIIGWKECILNHMCYNISIVCGKIILRVGLIFFPLRVRRQVPPTTPLATTVGRGGGGPMWMTRGVVVRLRCTSAAAAVVALRALVASSAINEPCRRRSASQPPLFAIVWLHRAPCSSPHGKLVWPPKRCVVDPPQTITLWCMCVCTYMISDHVYRGRRGGFKNNKNKKLRTIVH